MRYPIWLLTWLLAACSPPADTQNPAATAKTADLPVVPIRPPVGPVAPVPSGGATGWPAPFAPGATCQLTARQAAAIRLRPAAGAPLFGHLAVGDKVMLAAQTTDGWVGFNPGTAQAANVGIFRLRWVRAYEAFGLGKSCGQLPVVQAPPLGCLLMAQHATTVRRQPASGAAPLSTIPTGSYAQVVKSAVGPAKWLAVLVPGQSVPGYVALADANLTGDCQQR